MRVAIYARVSADDKGQDPENQLRELRDWVINSGHVISREYVDYESGRNGAEKRKQFIEADRVILLSGNPVAIAVPTDSGRPHEIYRCPFCKVAVWSVYGGISKLCFVRVGTLDNPAALAPDVHIYVRSKLPWITLPKGVPSFDAYYDSRKLWPPARVIRSPRRRLLAGSAAL